MNRSISFILKTSISLILLWLLIDRVDLNEVKRLAASVDWMFLAGGFLCVMSGVVLSCYKWQAILEVDNVVCPLVALVRFYLIGNFFNNFLPTSIGGDAVRAYCLSRSCSTASVGISSILAERFSGLIVLILFPVAAFFDSSTFVPRSIPGMLAGFVTLVALLFCILLIPTVRNACVNLLPVPIGREVVKFSNSIFRYLFDGRTLGVMTICSILFNGLMILAAWFVAGAIGLDLRILDLMVVVPLVVVLTLLPFSLNGLGLREGGFVFLLADLGISTSEALSFSLLNYCLVLVVSTMGGVIFWWSRSRSV